MDANLRCDPKACQFVSLLLHEIAMTPSREELEAFWMPFTANRQFKAQPRLLVRAEGMHYWSEDGRQILDGTAGLWCVNAGHARTEITAAVTRQLGTMDYAPNFQMGHPPAFALANRLIEHTPGDLDHVFFSNSGSEAVDSALKIALAYHRVRGDAARTRFIGREKAYHGVGFGGISVGGMVNNRKWFGSLLPGVDHLPHTLNQEHNRFAKGEPEWGAHLADDLERIVQLHDPSTIAAVIVEPLSGSVGVLPPPKGYLKRLRALCDQYGLLLIFDEVITGFGRLGQPFAAQYFDVLPDMITSAKALTNATIPMGATFVRKHVYDAFMQGPESAIDLFHGYTYSGHPVACAAASATLDIFQQEGLFTRVGEIERYWQDAAHSLRDLPQVVDIRNLGLIAGIEFAAIPGKVGARGFEVFVKCFEKGLLVRGAGDTIALSPPLIISKAQIDELFGVLSEVVRALP
jgi:beta-alanine--pyruvate transaminase